MERLEKLGYVEVLEYKETGKIVMRLLPDSENSLTEPVEIDWRYWLNMCQQIGTAFHLIRAKKRYTVDGPKMTESGWTKHIIGDAGCKACNSWPDPCGCGGLIHVSDTKYDDWDDGYNNFKCDRCDKEY